MTGLVAESAVSSGSNGSVLAAQKAEPAVQHEPLAEHRAIAEFDAQVADDETPRGAASDDPQISLRDGLIVSLGVLRVLWRLEDGGARFELTSDGGFRAITLSALTPDDATFLRAYRTEARKILEYEADDSHLRKS